MKNKFVLLIVVIFALLANVKLIAQLEPPCDFPCEGEIWVHHELASFEDPLCPGCIFQITYDEQMVPCNGIPHYNVYVSKIVWSPACEQCYTPGPEMLFRGYNIMMDYYYNHILVSEHNVITFSHIACWTGVAPAVFLLEPCPGSSGCCTSTITVEYIDGEYVSTAEWYYVPQDSCPYGCCLTCETQWYEKKSTYKTYKLTRPEIVPNPAKDLLNVSFESNYIGKVKLQVYKLNGDLAMSINRDKPNNSFVTPVDVSGLESGAYIIYIYINDSQMIWSNKFVIEK